MHHTADADMHGSSAGMPGSQAKSNQARDRDSQSVPGSKLDVQGKEVRQGHSDEDGGVHRCALQRRNARQPGQALVTRSHAGVQARLQRATDHATFDRSKELGRRDEGGEERGRVEEGSEAEGSVLAKLHAQLVDLTKGGGSEGGEQSGRVEEEGEVKGSVFAKLDNQLVNLIKGGGE
eukprot:362907-Chlamydomonas_euryale.AAC.1